MARMSKAEYLRRYRKNIEHAREWRLGEGLDDRWSRMIDLYQGRHFENVPAEDRIKINLAFSTINVIFPSITVNHPKITVQARSPEDDAAAVIGEAVVNYWWRHHDFKKPTRRASKDFLVMGHGWIKISWVFEQEEQPLSDKELDQAFVERANEVDAYAQERPELADELPSDEDIFEGLDKTKMVTTADHPLVERISPFDMYVDPEATSLEDAAWIAQRIVRPIDEVRADKRYSQTARTSVTGDSLVRTERWEDRERRKRDDDADRVTIWEFYDLKQKTMCVFTEGNENYLIDPQPMPYAMGHPFVYMANYEIPDEFYPMGDLDQLEDVQQELNKTRTQLLNQRKKYNRKYLAKKFVFDANAREALESDEDGVVVFVDDDNTPLSEAIMPMPQVPMAADLYAYSELIEADIDVISGVSEYARGAAPEIRRTATEAALMSDAQQARAADKLAIVEATLAEVARKILQLAQQFLTGEQVARVVGADGNQYWFQYEPDDIAGEFDFEVEAGSTQPNNEQVQRQQAMQMLQALGPLMGVTIDPLQFTNYILQEGFGIKSPQKFLMAPPPPPPMEGEEAPPEEGGEAPPQEAPPQQAPEAQGPVGVSAPQLSPEEVLALQQMAAMRGI